MAGERAVSWGYPVIFAFVFGVCLVAFFAGTITGRDSFFAAALLFFLGSILVAVPWAWSYRRARWLLACLVGLASLIAIQYVVMLRHRADVIRKGEEFERRHGIGVKADEHPQNDAVPRPNH